MEVAQIPAHSITVLPATGASTGTPVAAAEPAHAGTPVVTTATTSTPWRWIALASLGLWLLSVLAWWLWRRRRAAPASEPKHTSVRSRSEEHTSELQSLMRISYAVVCFKKKKNKAQH